MTYTAQEKALLSNTDVLGYIRAENTRVNTQAKSEGWDFWTTIPESMANEYANVYELEHCYAVGTFSDMYKDVWGVRPRWSFNKKTLSQLQEEIADLCASAEREAIEDARWEVQEREYAELCAIENDREEARLVEKAQRAAESAKIDMLFSIQDSLMGF